MSKRQRNYSDDHNEQPSRKRQRMNNNKNRNHHHRRDNNHNNHNNNNNNNNSNNYNYESPNPHQLIHDFTKMMDGIDDVGHDIQMNLEDLVQEWNKNMDEYGIKSFDSLNNNISFLFDHLQQADFELMRQITSLAMEIFVKFNDENNCPIRYASKCTDFCLKKIEQQKYEKMKQFQQEKKERDQMFGDIHSINADCFPFPILLKNKFCLSQNKLPPHLKKFDNLYHNGFIIEMTEPPNNHKILKNIKNKKYKLIRKCQSEQPIKTNYSDQSIFDRFKYQKKVVKCGGNFVKNNNDENVNISIN